MLQAVMYTAERAAALGGGVLGIPLWAETIRLVVPILWSLAVTLLGLRRVQRLAWGKTIVVGLVAYAASGLVGFTYMR